MKQKRILIFVFIVLLSPALLAAQNFNAYTIDSWPPFMYVENGEISGKATDIVKEIFHQSDLNLNIHTYPWPMDFMKV